MVDEQSQHGFPWRITGLVAVIVIAASALAGVLLSRNEVQNTSPDEPSIFTPAPDLLPVEKKRQVTMLFQIRDRGKDVASNVLIGAGGDTGFVSELVLPRDLLLPTTPPVQLKDVDGPRGPVSAQGPLQVLLDVNIDANIEMDRLAWAGIIDSTGALEHPEQGQTASSFPLVVSKVLAKLPKDENTLGQLLTSLGSMAPTTVTNEDASHLLAVIGDSLRTQPVRQAVLPVTYIRGGSNPVAVISQPQAARTVTDLFPKAPLLPGHSGPTRLVLQRSGATIGASIEAYRSLGSAGFGVVRGADVAVPAATSSIYVPVDSQQALSRGRDAAKALGLPATVVAVDAKPDAEVDVRVVLGADYRPV